MRQPDRHSTSFNEEELEAYVALMTTLRAGGDVRVILRSKDLQSLEIKLRSGLKSIQKRRVAPTT